MFKKFLKEEKDKFESCTVQTCDIPELLIDVLKGVQRSIPSEKLTTKEDSEGWVENGLQTLFHITVLYGVRPEALLVARNSFVAPFVIRTDQIDYFDNEEKGFSVLILKCDSKDLTDYHYILKGQVENKHKFAYVPHITLAYLKLNERLDLFHGDAFNFTWNCKQLEMSMANGTIEKININN